MRTVRNAYAVLLEFFGQPIPLDMTGRPLRPAMESGKVVQKCMVFGYHGGEIVVTDGKWLYMNAPGHPEVPCYYNTLMPTYMRCCFRPEELRTMELAEPFSFTEGMRTLKVLCQNSGFSGTGAAASRLFDLEKDPGKLEESAG